MTEQKKHIVLISNSFGSLYNFRYELILTLLKDYRVTLLTPMEESDYVHFATFMEQGCELLKTPLRRRGKNPFSEWKLISLYVQLLKKLNPDLVLTYTIKPNIYGGMACKKLKIPYFSNVTGLGTAFQKEGMLKKLTVFLFRRGVKHAELIFFQNEESQKVFKRCRIGKGNSKIVPGSGINLDKFPMKPYTEDNAFRFLYMARIMKEKGADEFFAAARRMKEKYKEVEFAVVGFCEETYETQIKELEKQGVITYYGWQDDSASFMAKAGCLVNPSYHEGMSNVCLEAAATGRPMIVSDIPGCRETVENGTNGYLIPAGDGEALLAKMIQFYQLSTKQKAQMGQNGRRKMEQEFDRQLVVEIYCKEIRRVLENDKN